MTDLTQVALPLPPDLVPGRLIRRYKRFLAQVRLDDGREVTAHCPNSGAMTGCMAPDCPVLLSPAADPYRKTPYTWELSHMHGVWVGINTSWPNRLAARCAELRAHPLFAQARAVRREVRVGSRSRLDLMVELPGGLLYVEVKNVTLVVDDQARFPDAVTSRGARHLEELMALKAQGHRAAMLYLVQRPDAESFAPAADIDPTYAAGLARARAAGVEVAVIQARPSPHELRLWRELPLAPGI